MLPHWLPIVEYFTFQNSVIKQHSLQVWFKFIPETACVLLYNGSLEWVMWVKRSHNEF